APEIRLLDGEGVEHSAPLLLRARAVLQQVVIVDKGVEAALDGTPGQLLRQHVPLVVLVLQAGALADEVAQDGELARGQAEGFIREPHQGYLRRLARAARRTSRSGSRSARSASARCLGGVPEWARAVSAARRTDAASSPRAALSSCDARGLLERARASTTARRTSRHAWPRPRVAHAISPV